MQSIASYLVLRVIVDLLIIDEGAHEADLRAEVSVVGEGAVHEDDQFRLCQVQRDISQSILGVLYLLYLRR